MMRRDASAAPQVCPTRSGKTTPGHRRGKSGEMLRIAKSGDGSRTAGHALGQFAVRPFAIRQLGVYNSLPTLGESYDRHTRHLE
jgi:hypothetical protein